MLYAHFDLSEDFAHNAQAWFLIGHGDLSPLDTVRIPTTPFWRDHFDLIVWPLSLLELVEGSPFSLLVVQDLALVAAEVVTVFWVVGVCSEHLEQGWPRTGAALAATALLVADPWWYEAASFDVHLPPLGLFLVMLTAYPLWCGRYRRAVTAAALCVLFGAVVVELVVFVALAGLCCGQGPPSGWAPDRSDVRRRCGDLGWCRACLSEPIRPVTSPRSIPTWRVERPMLACCRSSVGRRLTQAG